MVGYKSHSKLSSGSTLKGYWLDSLVHGQEKKNGLSAAPHTSIGAMPVQSKQQCVLGSMECTMDGFISFGFGSVSEVLHVMSCTCKKDWERYKLS